MTSNTKIIIVTPWFGEFAGGAEFLSKSLAIEFNKRGMTSVCISVGVMIFNSFKPFISSLLTPSSLKLFKIVLF